MLWVEPYAEVLHPQPTPPTQTPKYSSLKKTIDDIVKKWMDVILWIIADHILGTLTPFGLFANFWMKKSCIA